jgi:uncharacterized protein
VRGERTRATRDDPMLDVLSRRGTEHERNHLERLKAEGKTVVEIPDGYRTRADLRAAQEATVEAMRAGADAIYQATFFTEAPADLDGAGAHPRPSSWRGHADFLLRVDTPSTGTPSRFGDWHYEVADTKLARRVKAAAILQMCAYSEQLAPLQGVTPEQVHVITGDGESHPFRLADYSAYYRHLKGRYEALVGEAIAGAPRSTYPDPVDHCGICRWQDDCKDRADDHLSLVRGATRCKAPAVGVTTCAGWPRRPAASTCPARPNSVARLHQALQVEASCHPPIYKILPPERHDLLNPADPEQRWPQRAGRRSPRRHPATSSTWRATYALDD